MGNTKADINIDIGNNGKIVYDHQEFTGERGKKVTWACKYPYAIQFRHTSAINEGSRPVKESNGVMKGTVKMDIKSGTYTYACALYADGNVYLDAACPAIIID